MTTNLTPHFTLEEFSRGRVIPEAYMGNVNQLADLFEAFRTAGGGVAIDVTSGYRDPVTNALAGGVKDSQHLEAGAGDGVPRMDLETWARQVLSQRDSLPPWGQFILENDGHFHLSIPRNNVRQVLVEVGRNKYAPWDGVGPLPPWGSLPGDIHGYANG